MNLADVFKTLWVNFQFILGLMKSNFCVPLRNLLHKNL